MACEHCFPALKLGRRYCGDCGVATRIGEIRVACMRCLPALVAGHRYCSECGVATNVDEKIVCGKCGECVHKKDKFCGECRQEVVRPKPAPSRSVNDETPVQPAAPRSPSRPVKDEAPTPIPVSPSFETKPFEPPANLLACIPEQYRAHVLIPGYKLRITCNVSRGDHRVLTMLDRAMHLTPGESEFTIMIPSLMLHCLVDGMTVTMNYPLPCMFGARRDPLYLQIRKLDLFAGSVEFN